MASVCVLTLCGLPAAGKTTFAALFTDYVQQLHASSVKKSDVAEDQRASSFPYRVIRIDYDKLIPSEAETPSSDDKEQSVVSQWKLYRKAILRCINSFLGCLCGQPLHGTDDNLSDMSTDVIYKKISPVFSKLYEGLCTATGQGAVILMIDDNMYYASMRFQLYQLARKYSTGYAQIYFPIDVSEALERNSQRSLPVADDVIVCMSSKMDVPSPQNSWEAFTTEWHSADYGERNFGINHCGQSHSCGVGLCIAVGNAIVKSQNGIIVDVNMRGRHWQSEKVIALVEEALCNPVMSGAENSESERQESRSVCSKNVHHQSDCILRHLLTDFVTALKTEVTDSAEISRQAKQANAVRQRILDDLRQQTLVIPRLTVDSLTQYDIKPTCSSHPLHVFLKQVFTERLSEPS